MDHDAHSRVLTTIIHAPDAGITRRVEFSDNETRQHLTFHLFEDGHVEVRTYDQSRRAVSSCAIPLDDLKTMIDNLMEGDE